MNGASNQDIGASVRARLLQLARERGEDFQLMLTRYANERLLFRLATSSHAEQFVLKGASLFTLWTGSPHRATRDLDLLGFGMTRADASCKCGGGAGAAAVEGSLRRGSAQVRPRPGAEIAERGSGQDGAD